MVGCCWSIHDDKKEKSLHIAVRLLPNICSICQVDTSPQWWELQAQPEWEGVLHAGTTLRFLASDS